MCQPHLHAHKNPPNTPTYTNPPPPPNNMQTKPLIHSCWRRRRDCWRGMNHQGFEGIHGSLREILKLHQLEPSTSRPGKEKIGDYP
ncbi:hypothetical protein Syun_020933 [Stephania yunnanensis]|uniref:Uncharacterized protein n=1 Tax=Stephania yunnanensis TaxID=152371 RepID=A0AAP0IG28_9MAGN